MAIERLKSLLSKNYEALGFSMVVFEVLPFNSSRYYENILRIMLRCPCGGYEVLNSVIELDRLKTETYIRVFAEDTLATTCSYSHLKADVENGTLPPFDIEKHVFKTLVY